MSSRAMAARRAVRRPLPSRAAPRHAGTGPTQKKLFKGTDHGADVALDPRLFAPAQQGGGWGPFVDAFLRLNEQALASLDLKPSISSSDAGVRLALTPGGRTGAIPLRSAQTGHVTSGMLIEPRFGWSGVGRVLSAVGWHAGPEFIEGPLVPGSGREVPPWVLAGPVLARFADLLKAMRRGYHAKEAVLTKPRGTIRWREYIATSLARGDWASLPCRFPDLASDPHLRRMLRWGLERVRGELTLAGGGDVIARLLAGLADELLQSLRDVTPLPPRPSDLRTIGGGDALVAAALQRGLEALGWIVEERGLGGGREMDGLAWAIRLDQLWEQYVEHVVRREAALDGGMVRVARKGETVFPLDWSDPTHRSLGHLVPDIVVFRGDRVHVVDAKYKAHLAELDDHGWRRFMEDAREAHRAAVHQVLAYAALYEAKEVKATLVYPLRRATFEVLRARGREVARARLLHGARHVQLELRGLPFGS